ncbi:MAG: abortive phage infection protein [Methylomarinum sp.]|nr:abortive phage infection protein [Methylomarinum sp.]
MEHQLDELFKYRQDILDDSKDDDGFIQQGLVLMEVLPYMLDAKLIDSEDCNEAYFKDHTNNLKLNSYMVNESGERLQLFIIDENTIDESTSSEELNISQKKTYENQFKRASKFISLSLSGKLYEQVQDADPIKALVSKLNSDAGIQQFDVIEIFLISLTATVSHKGLTPQPRNIRFDDDRLKVNYSESGEKKSKEFLLLRQVIDLNFLLNAIVSRGNRDSLTINFTKSFGYNIEIIKAAEDSNFESYLCVLKADILSDLYRRYSSRLLEKNVRSFLQFRGVNKGIKETIRKEPEKFIAYNNGLTITATDANIFQHKRKLFLEALTDFQIVNGGQTTASIYFSKKEGLDISKVKVMAKINVVKEAKNGSLDDLISKISEYSNSQSRVSKVDLRARNPQLVKLKQLSESVITPSGSKWFFERAKGEFNTKVRMGGSKANRIKNEFPTSRRFTKELLAKYYSAWGDKPYMVKKGGEKIFRYFIEQIAAEGESQSPIEIDRDFYEALISKIILFRRLEKIYGQGKNSMGQLRSATIPYALSIVYTNTDGAKAIRKFDLSKIWKKEEVEDDLVEYFKSLMLLINDLIKKYSASDDYGEYSKKIELWSEIKNCVEITRFLMDERNNKVLEKYCISTD